jgi:heme A synthase
LLLVVEVSYFGALVVLRGLPAGWAAVDVGSALLVVALMVAAAVIASIGYKNPHLPDRLAFHDPFSRLVLVAAVIVYAILVSGVLVAGPDPLVGCLGWPIYGRALQQAGSLSPWQAARLASSVVGAGLIVAVVVQAWRSRGERPEVYHFARRLGIAFMVEALLQVLILAFRAPTILLVAYTITAAAFWGLLVAMLVRIGLEESTNKA